MMFPAAALFIALFFVDVEAFPSYNQQCADDAGPPFVDDSETYGSNPYHFGSAAQPVLKGDGQCANPIEGACGARGDAKTAYLEGPIDCGGNGWFCRILIDENWPPIALTSDVNFGYCNKTDGFNDPGYDGDGHCHGSDSDSTYYWWVRDHWFRQYNGHLRCCCNWNSGSDPLTGGRIVNRCDFRKELQPGENENCRDANEEHSSSFNGGCDQSYGPEQLGKPISENEEKCWEVTRFGFAGEGGDNGEEEENGGGDGEEEEGNGEEEGEDEEGDEGEEDGEGDEEDGEGDEEEDGEGDEEEEEDNGEEEGEDEEGDEGEDNGEGDEEDGEGDEEEDEEEEEDNGEEEGEDEEGDEGDEEDGEGDEEEDGEGDEEDNGEGDEEGNEEGDEDCMDDPEFRFKDVGFKDCGWVGKKPYRRCVKEWKGTGIFEYCPDACGLCD